MGWEVVGNAENSYGKILKIPLPVERNRGKRREAERGNKVERGRKRNSESSNCR